MQQYRLFAMVDVRHDYFADGCARHLRFQPDADTLAFLRRFGMVLRADGNSLAINVADAALQGMWSERMDGDAPRALRFHVHCADDACAYYTAAVTAASQAEDDGALPAPLMAVQGGPAAPLTIIALPLVATNVTDVAAWTSTLGTRYRAHMQSRSTVWKYLFTGDWRGRALSIVDQRGEVGFTALAQERLPNGQAALSARSTSPIALRERPPQRFQLRDTTETPERVLISRLPGAQPQRLWRELLGGEPTTVSEIFVHS